MRLRNAIGCYRCMLGLLGLLVLAHPTAQAEGEFDGQVELLYRSVNVDGSSSKYEEDFNGLDSGVRLGQFQMNWQDVGSSFLDYARLNFTGLGGEPFEYSSLAIGRKDVYDLRFTSRKQDYLYNLFQVTDDEDGHSWNTERRMTKIDLSFYVTEKVDILVSYDEVTRTGNSLFMKDIQRDLFRLETPIDQNVKRFSAGFRVKTGRNRVFFLQTLRRYDYIFDNFTEGNEGLNTGDPATLTNYAWRQNDDGTANLSTLRWDSA